MIQKHTHFFNIAKRKPKLKISTLFVLFTIKIKMKFQILYEQTGGDTIS